MDNILRPSEFLNLHKLNPAQHITMSQKENVPLTGTKRKARSDNSSGDVFTCSPRKQSKTDPLVGFGHHFGRTIRSFCRLQPLIKNGMTWIMQLELERITEADLSPSELKEHDIYVQLLALSPGLEERLCTGSDQEIFYVADMITKGASGASVLSPPLQRNVKTDRGFHHPQTGELLCPVNLNWNDDK
ncbi:hypothetical protein EST38_g12556 [Candolleomyces aberdarensis]|uniref:Uncharacterized protein n=1 Tax=Candolleomyces aberdarensis TaxID=2316362 RepID=A0A4Q2D238_9AGAR|nr:hypothetical protein EST38_g12556 [Candolleomyces aberdarensis]